MRTSFRAAVLGLGMVLTGSFILPAEAMPVPQQPQAKSQSDVQVVRDNGKQRIWRHRSNRGFKSFRGRNYGWRHNTWRGRHVGYRSWRGHRGYSYYRHGYRRYNGFWFPPAAFSVGVIVGPRLRVGGSHVRWCYNQYASYRRSDNTFQPYNGPRRACISPYAR